MFDALIALGVDLGKYWDRVSGCSSKFVQRLVLGWIVKGLGRHCAGHPMLQMERLVARTRGLVMEAPDPLAPTPCRDGLVFISSK